MIVNGRVLVDVRHNNEEMPLESLFNIIKLHYVHLYIILYYVALSNIVEKAKISGHLLSKSSLFKLTILRLKNKICFGG